MPDVQEVFRVATQKVRPDPGALERQQRAQRRRSSRRRIGAFGVVAAIAACALLVGGLTRWMDGGRAGAPATRAVDVGGMIPTPDRLAGIWLLDGAISATPGEEALMVRFSRGGTVAFDDTGTLDTAPKVLGSYRVSGRTVSFRVGPQSTGCTPGDTWVWQAGLPDQGRLKAVTVEDGTGNCRVGLGTELTFTRVSPLSPYLELEFPIPGGAADPPPDAYAVGGIWLLKGSGALLRLSGEGTYAIDGAGELGAAPSDVGTFRVHGATMTFISGTASRACAAGDVWVWRHVAQDGRGLRGSVTTDECRGRAGGTTWGVHDALAYRLSPP